VRPIESLTAGMYVASSNEIIASIRHKSYDRAQLLLCAGVREQGKTYALNLYLDQGEPRVLAFDPFGDFASLSWPSNGDEEDLECALGDMAHWQIACRKRVRPPRGQGSRAWADDAFAMIIEGMTTDDGETIAALRRSLLLLDEITMWSATRETETLQKLVLQGRRLKLRMAVACQRIALVPGVLLSECTDLVVFKTVRPRDLDVLEEWGESERVRGRADGIRSVVTRLDQGECVLVHL
jgi:hypothetical protein